MVAVVQGSDSAAGSTSTTSRPIRTVSFAGGGALGGSLGTERVGRTIGVGGHGTTGGWAARPARRPRLYAPRYSSRQNAAIQIAHASAGSTSARRYDFAASRDAAFFAAARISGLAASNRATDQRSPFSRVTVEMTEGETPTAAAICLTDSPVDLKNAATVAGSAFGTMVRGVARPRLMAPSTASRTATGATAVPRHAMSSSSPESGSRGVAVAARLGIRAGAARPADRAVDWASRTVAAWAACEALTSSSGGAVAAGLGIAICFVEVMTWLPSLGSRGARPESHSVELSATRPSRSTALAAQVARDRPRHAETGRNLLEVPSHRFVTDHASAVGWLEPRFEVVTVGGGHQEQAFYPPSYPPLSERVFGHIKHRGLRACAHETKTN